MASNLMYRASRYVDWATTAGFDLDTETLLDRGLIQYYVTQLAANSSKGQASASSLLGQIVRAQTDPTFRVGVPNRDNASAPYTRSELIEFSSWATSRHTAAQRTNAMAVLALGAGAGLSAAEILAAAPQHVEVTAGSARVEVFGVRARVVELRTEWVPMMADARSDRRDAPLMFDYLPGGRSRRDAIHKFARNVGDIGVRLNSERLRSTWVVSHVLENLPLDILMSAAGWTSISALQRFLPMVKRAPAESQRLQRGRGLQNERP